ncbi:MAG: hypothetical protein V4719_05300 [Planctomycetota bacterium]
MNITQTLTFSVIALLAGTFAFSDDLNSLLTPGNSPGARPSRSRGRKGEENAANRARGREFAQAEKVEKPAAEASGPKDILLSAAEKLKSHASVRANMSEKVAIQTHSFTAKGSYLQGQNLQLRMEFTVELGSQKGSLLEVCDGQVLWSRHDLGEKDQTQITRRDVRQILQAAEQAEQRLKTPEEKAMLNASIVADLGIGGLPALLAAFAKDYDFSKATDGKIDDREVVTLDGTWNAAYRAMWRDPKSKDKTPPPLPVYVPDSVRLSFDKETEFPRRIEYLKLIPGNSTPTALLTVDFTKVVFNSKVSRDDFVFIPPERPAPIDITQMYLQRLMPAKAPPTKAPPVPTETPKAAK